MALPDHSLFLVLLIMSLVAPIGAYDVLYYHIWKFRLFDRYESRWETVTHLVREAVFLVLLVLLYFYSPHGAWFWLIAGLAALDFVNNLVDAFLEPASRATLGGLPRSEMVVHIAGATASGAITALLLYFGWELRLQPTNLVRVPAAEIPSWLLGIKPLMVTAVLALLIETGLFARSIWRRGWRAA